MFTFLLVRTNDGSTDGEEPSSISWGQLHPIELPQFMHL